MEGNNTQPYNLGALGFLPFLREGLRMGSIIGF